MNFDGLTRFFVSRNAFSVGRTTELIIVVGLVDDKENGDQYKSVMSVPHELHTLDYTVAQPNDIALVKTDRDMLFYDHVQPILLAPPNYYVEDDTPVVLSGWGGLKVSIDSFFTLLVFELPLFAFRQCVSLSRDSVVG